MKKLFSTILSCIIISLLSSMSFAQTPASKQTYTLSEVRQLALQNAETLDTFKMLRSKYQKELLSEESRMGDKYKDYDDNGKEITKYTSGKKLSYDYDDKIKELDKKIKQLKRQNELSAIQKYHSILDKQIDIQKQVNDIEVQQTNFSIAEKSLHLGRLTQIDYQTAQANLNASISQKQQLQTELDALFEDLNRLIGLKKASRYLLDTDQLLTKTSVNDFVLSVPADAISYVRKDSSLLKDMNVLIQEKKKQLEIFSKIHPIGSSEYEALEKEIDLYGMEKELRKKNNDLYFDLEQDYLSILLSLLNLSNLKEEIDFDIYQDNINRLKYQNGLISKQRYIQENTALLDRKQDLFSQTFQAYQKIVQYEIKTGTNLLE